MERFFKYTLLKFLRMLIGAQTTEDRIDNFSLALIALTRHANMMPGMVFNGTCSPKKGNHLPIHFVVEVCGNPTNCPFGLTPPTDIHMHDFSTHSPSGRPH